MIIKSYLAENNKELFNNNLVLFYGENIGLLQDFKKKIKDNFNVSQIYNLNQVEVLENEKKFYVELFNTSLFDENKIFIIEQCDDKILSLIEEVETKLEKQKIFLFAEILQKKSKLRSYFENSKKNCSIACYKDNEIGLRKIILDKLKGFKNLNSQIVNTIIENCNLDRAKLSNELDKLTTYFSNKEIDREKLEELLNIRENDNFSDLRDKAIAGDTINTNKLLNNIYIEIEKSIFYISILNQRLTRIKDTISISSNNLELDIDKIKPPLFWKDKPIFLEQMKKWNIKKINIALNNTYKLEMLLKSNNLVDKNILIKKTIIDICNLANAA